MNVQFPDPLYFNSAIEVRQWSLEAIEIQLVMYGVQAPQPTIIGRVDISCVGI